MRNGFLASLLGLLVAASLVLGQPPQPMPAAPPPGGESKPAPAEPVHQGILSPLSVFDGLTSHFEGTCSPPKGDVLFADVDYLFWVLRNANVPVPLASTISTSAAGVTTSSVLMGQHDLAYHHRPSSGVRVSLAYWQEDPLPEIEWDKPRTVGVEANYLVLAERGIAMRNDTAPVLIRPFFNVNNRTDTGLVPTPISLVAAPGFAGGGVTATANYGLWGGELNLWKNIYYEYPGRTVRLDFLAGFRYLDLGEDLSVASLSIFSPTVGGGFGGNQLLINDLFNTRDQFYGGQIGAVLKFFLETLDLTLTTKLAFGDSAEQVHIEGFQVRTLANGTTVPSQGGLLALPSNIGRFHHDTFSVVPEFDAIASYAICRHLTLTAGYQFIYWSRVLRPGDQIDPVINVTQIPNFPTAGVPASAVVRPTVPLRQTDFWAQGLTVGLQFVW